MPHVTVSRRDYSLKFYLGAKGFEITANRRDREHSAVAKIRNCAVLRFDLSVDLDLVPFLRMADVEN
jgi:hypothetical protein